MSNNTYGKDFWDQRYSVDSYLYGEAPNDFLRENLACLRDGGEILCLSEGEGRNGVYLATKGFRVTGVDLSSVAKEKALKLAEKNKTKINYHISNIKDYDLGENKWDGIIAIFAHTPSSIRKNLHQDIKKALKKGGVFLLEGYNKKQLEYDSGGPKDQDLLYSIQELEKDFNNFKILKLQNQLRDFQEGIAHQGEASVVQFIAQKLQGC